MYNSKILKTSLLLTVLVISTEAWAETPAQKCQAICADTESACVTNAGNVLTACVHACSTSTEIEACKTECMSNHTTEVGMCASDYQTCNA